MTNNTYSSNTITLNGAGAMNTLGQSSISLDDTYLNNLFKNITRSDYVKRYEVIETSEDVLALSVAWKRLRDNKDKSTLYIGITSLLDDNLFRRVEEPDRVHANEIRDYFSKKIMLWSLKSVKLSKYRQDLNTFIHGNDKKVTEELLPIVFRLPEFYEYDVKFDSFKREVKLDLPTFDSPPLKQITTLTPITSFYKSNKRIKQFEYWLKNSNGNAHMIAIEPKNPLKPIWDKMFINEHLRIEGTYFPKKYDELQYYQLLNWNLI